MNSTVKKVLIVAGLVAASVTPLAAQAHGGVSVDIGIGGGYYGPSYYAPAPVYYAPTPVYYGPAYYGYGPRYYGPRYYGPRGGYGYYGHPGWRGHGGWDHGGGGRGYGHHR